MDTKLGLLYAGALAAFAIGGVLVKDTYSRFNRIQEHYDRPIIQGHFRDGETREQLENHLEVLSYSESDEFVYESEAATKYKEGNKARKEEVEIFMSELEKDVSKREKTTVLKSYLSERLVNGKFLLFDAGGSVVSILGGLSFLSYARRRRKELLEL